MSDDHKHAFRDLERIGREHDITERITQELSLAILDGLQIAIGAAENLATDPRAQTMTGPQALMELASVLKQVKEIGPWPATAD